MTQSKIENSQGCTALGEARAPSDMHQVRMLNELHDSLEEASGWRPVHHSVIERQAQPSHGTDDDLLALRHRPSLDPTHAQNRRFRQVDDGGKGIYAEHPQVGECKGPAREFLGSQFVRSNSFDEISGVL